MFELGDSYIAEFYFRCFSSCLDLVKLSLTMALGNITKVFESRTAYYFSNTQAFSSLKSKEKVCVCSVCLSAYPFWKREKKGEIKRAKKSPRRVN